MSDNVTLCITMGRRPDLLGQTLDSLRDVLSSMPVLGINDFRDAETGDVFRALCPHGTLIDPGRKLGHHAAVDALYSQVATPYIFHCEDDWRFTGSDFLAPAIALLDSEPLMSSVCLRALSDMSADEQSGAIRHTSALHQDYVRLDAMQDQWYGYTFNPHIGRLALWRDIGGFAQFPKERHISRHLRQQGRFVAYTSPGMCTHIGEANSVSVPRLPLFTRVKRWARARR